MNILWQDLRYGWRAMLRQPLFTVAAVLVLALGIGANTALFSLVDAVLLRPLPYPEADRLMVLLNVENGRVTASASLPDYLDWRAAQRSFTDLALVRRDSFNFSAPTQAPERVSGGTVTANFLDVMGVHPTLGRNFSVAEDTPGGATVALLGDTFWRKHYGANPAVIGQRIVLDGVSREIVGVLPPTVNFPRKADVFIPLGDLRQDKNYLDRGAHYGFRTVGRLKPGITQAQAFQDMDNIARELERRYPAEDTDQRLALRPLLTFVVGDYGRSLYVLLGAVVCVLLIACANVANLQLARATGRRKELAVRTALGATRGRLMRQLLTESTLLGLLGGGVGVLLALWALDAMVTLSPADAPRFHEAHLNLTALAFAALVAIGAGLVAGAWPAWRITGNVAMATALHEGSARGGSGGAGQGRARSVLVVLQVALAVVLLASAGLMFRSFWQARNEPLGFRSDHLLTAVFSLPQTRYDSRDKQAMFFSSLLERVRALPGVAAAAVSSGAPFSGDNSDGSFHVTGTPPSLPGKDPEAVFNSVSPGYFQTLGMPISPGQDFGPQDSLNQPKSILVDEDLARRYFPGQNPVGRHLDKDMGSGDIQVMTIVGVVPHVRTDAPGEQSSRENMVQMYFCAAQLPQPDQSLLVRVTSGDPLKLVDSIRRVIRTLDPELPITQVRTMEEGVASDFVAQRSTVVLLSAFAAVALVLASIGLYGVMALSVTQRTRELGIRMALGSPRAAVLRLVMRQGAILVGIGLGVGLVAALVSGKLLSSVLYGVSGADPTTLGAVSLVLAVAASVACLLPAQRASRVDPMVALRNE